MITGWGINSKDQEFINAVASGNWCVNIGPGYHIKGKASTIRSGKFGDVAICRASPHDAKGKCFAIEINPITIGLLLDKGANPGQGAKGAKVSIGFTLRSGSHFGLIIKHRNTIDLEVILRTRPSGV